jgi:hypothetical protein
MTGHERAGCQPDRRRLSIVSGFFALLQARGDVDANPGMGALPAWPELERNFGA